MLPTENRQIVVERVLARLLDRETPQTLTKALKAEGITADIFHRVVSGDRQLALSYVRALEIRSDLLADEALDIADTEPDAAKARNRIEVRKWLASKHNTKRYGDRIDLNVTQTLDVAGTLQEARARLLRPVSDQLGVSDAQVIDMPRQISDGAPVMQSVDVPRPGDEPDIFS